MSAERTARPRILITGAAGMLGSDLLEILGARFEARGLDLRPSSAGPGAVVLCDLTEPGSVRKAFEDFRPGIVFHAAAMTHVDGCERDPETARRVNVEATGNVVEAANRTGAAVVFFSTDYVFDGRKGAPYTEKDRPCPLSCYGRTKREAEELIESRAGHYVIFRVSWLFGRNGPSFPRTILERAGSVPSFEVVNDQVGRPTYTRDVARALRDLFVRVSWQAAADRQIFHLGNSGEVSWADYAEMILESYPGAKPSVVKIATPLGHRPAVRPLHSVLALEKAERELGIRLRPWREAVNDFIKHELIVGQP